MAQQSINAGVAAGLGDLDHSALFNVMNGCRNTTLPADNSTVAHVG
jgi:hypothetical protein